MQSFVCIQDARLNMLGLILICLLAGKSCCSVLLCIIYIIAQCSWIACSYKWNQGNYQTYYQWVSSFNVSDNCGLFLCVRVRSRYNLSISLFKCKKMYVVFKLANEFVKYRTSNQQDRGLLLVHCSTESGPAPASRQYKLLSLDEDPKNSLL